LSARKTIDQELQPLPNGKKGSIMKKLILAAAIAASTLHGPATAAEFSPQQKSEMEQIIRDYLLEHPELLEDMSRALEQKNKIAQDKATKEFLAANAKEVFRNGSDLVLGNPKGDVSVVEFYDYNCGWCKKGFPEIMSLVEADANLRVVLKEFPIFGEDSEYAARAAIASAKQGKAREMHVALFAHEGKVSKDIVDAAAKTLKLDMAKLEKDMTSEETSTIIARNQQLAQALAINGTPAFLVGDKLIPGFLPKEELTTTVNEVRQSGSCSKLC
jgi:protein-disulfide isomerase